MKSTAKAVKATTAATAPQMIDIARMAGVSVSTVSRALSGSTLVSDKTRQRIADIARSVHYAVNVDAQNLRLKQNRTIAVVVPYDQQSRQHVSDPFFLSMMGSLADAITDRGYDMLLSRVDAEHLDAVERLQRTGRAAGIVMIGQWHHHDQLNELAARRFPVVVWGAQLPQQLYCSVGGDNLSGGRLATRHLLELGRRRLVFLGDPSLPEARQRFEGYQQAHREFDVEADADLCRICAFTVDDARRAALALCESGLEFDAVFACSDLLAITMINVLHEQGRRVPQDVAVVGYDDIELAQHFNPPLTTVRQPIADAGRALVEALIAVIEGQRPRPVLLSTDLVIRASAGMPITAAPSKPPARRRK